MRETWVWPLGWEEPLEKEMSTNFSILAWRIPWTEEPGRPHTWGHKESDRTRWLTHSLSTVGTGILPSFPIFMGNIHTFPFSMMLFLGIFFIHAFYYVEKVLLSSYLRALFTRGCLDFIRWFSGSIDVILWFFFISLLIWWITLIFSVESALHPSKKLHLVIVS